MGQAVFDASVIAEFPGTDTNPDGGYTFEWYFDNKKLNPNDEFIKIETFFASSKLTITDIDYTDQDKEVYCIVDYKPFRNEGLVSTHHSNLKSLNYQAYPELQITEDPVSPECWCRCCAESIVVILL